jgi:membrane-associated phospholipid phosphatase
LTDTFLPSHRLPSHRDALRALSVGSVVMVAVVYVVAVRTAWGQRLDATALRGRGVLDPRAVHAAGRLLSTIDVASLAFVGTAIVLVSLARSRPLLAVGAGAIIAGSVLTSELLKHVVLGRPYLGVVDSLRMHASYPSGHTTVAMALGVAAMLVSPRRWRPIVAILAIGYASAIGVAVVATANHRPSDAIGAAFVVTAWAAAITSLLVGPADRDGHDRPSRATPWLLVAGAVLVVIGAVGLAATIAAIRHNRLGTVALGGAFFAASAAVVGTILVTTAALVAALGEDELE